MGVGTTLADRDLSEETIKNSSSRTKRGRQRHKSSPSMSMSMSAVQRLYETCTQVFDSGAPGDVPSPQYIDRLKLVLDELKPEDVGLTPDMPYFRKKVAHQVPAITYLHLYECDQFSMGIFCLPASGVIPLHNHPGMTVFSKLLFGTMHIKSYDWVDNSTGTDGEGVRLAKLKVNSELTAPCNTSILYPADGGNMHEFRGVTACAVLDVLGPPYDDPEGRHCQYYLDFPFTTFTVDGVSVPEAEQEGHAWLQERDKPEDLSVVGALYRGPKIVEK